MCIRNDQENKEWVLEEPFMLLLKQMDDLNFIIPRTNEPLIIYAMSHKKAYDLIVAYYKQSGVRMFDLNQTLRSGKLQ